MRKHRHGALASVSLAVLWFGCTTAAPSGMGGGPSAKARGTSTSQNAGGPASTGGGGTAPAGLASGETAPAATASANDAAGASALTGDSGAEGAGASSQGQSGTPAVTSVDAGGAPEAGEGEANQQQTAALPPPVTVPYVWGVGIGVTDLSSAV